MLEINKKKDIPKKNYFILGIILIISCILVYYINTWYSLYQYEKRGSSPITTYMEIINYNEVENDSSFSHPVLIQNPSTSFVLLSEWHRNFSITNALCIDKP